jgi:hypothetical protein
MEYACRDVNGPELSFKLAALSAEVNEGKKEKPTQR